MAEEAGPAAPRGVDLRLLDRHTAITSFLERALGTIGSPSPGEAGSAMVGAVCDRVGSVEAAVLAAADLAAVESIESIAIRLERDDEVLALRLDDGSSLLDLIEAWYRTLPELDRAVTRRLAVLPRGFSAACAQEIASGDGVSRADVLAVLRRLVAVGVLFGHDSGGRRRLIWRQSFQIASFHLLSQSSELAAVRARQARWCDEWAREVTAPVPPRAGAPTALVDEVATDLENTAGLLEWLVEHDVEAASALLVSLMPFWRAGHRAASARRLLDRVRQTSDDGRAGRARCGVHLASGELALLDADLEAADGHFDAAATAAEADADSTGLAAALEWRSAGWQLQGRYSEADRLAVAALDRYHDLGDRRGVARLLLRVGHLTSVRGDAVTARFGYLQALRTFRTVGDGPGITSALERLGQLHRIEENHVEAQPLLREALALSRIDAEPRAIAAISTEAARSAMEVGNLDDARRLVDEALAIYSELADRRGLAVVWSATGRLEYLRSDHVASRAAYAEALRAYRGIGDRRGAGVALVGLGNATLLIGAEGAELVRAAALVEEGVGELEAVGDARGAAWGSYTASEIYRDLGRVTDARNALGRARTLSGSAAHSSLEEAIRLGEAHLARAAGELEQAEQAARHSLSRASGTSGAVHLIRCITLQADIATAARDDERASVLFGAAEALRHEHSLAAHRRATTEMVRGALDLLRRRNDGDVVEAWLAQGRELSLEAARRYAAQPEPAVGGMASAGAAATRIRLLGGFDVVVDEAATAVPPGVEAGVLARLAVLGPRHVSELVDDLWPDSAEDVGRRRLKNVINKLRARVGPVVVRRGDVCALVPGIVVDAIEFEIAATAALRAIRSGQPTGEDICRSALEQYDGDLLPGLRYADWVLPVRLRLANLRLELLDALAERTMADGRRSEAVHWYERAIAADPLDIDRHVRLATILIERGWRARARAVVASALDVSRDLGYGPSTALRLLAVQLQVGSAPD